MLKIDNIDVYYGDVHVIRDLSMDVKQGELVAVIGGNGAGKTTLIKTISGILKPRKGSITFEGETISGMDANRLVGKGIVQIPEGRLLFPEMSVKENLEMGAYLVKDNAKISQKIDEMFTMFPILAERQKQAAGTLSGGEQQMLAIGRGLMSSPKLVMFDEPSLGLAPKLVQSIFEMVVRINKEMGMTVLLVEQNVQHSCKISDRAFVIENGEVVLQGTGQEMLANEHVRRAYLGL
ncbi:MAG TPA: ABC transporter ATP-binding protein [Bellilinea sp.]|jgi:branched-chain amino acid transport system ATP-binding protein|nr:ABC transporter ATP-binding protein [Bellilinea sp.]